MAKKARPRKQTDGDAGLERKRGRRPNTWVEGFGPANLIDYRRAHGLSEAKLARYLGVTLTTIRNWLAGENTPAEAKQRAIQGLIAKDYVAPAGGEQRPRGRPPRRSSPDAATAGGEKNGDAPPVRSSALAEVVAAYVRRLPPEQLLDIDQLEQHIARIKKALAT